MQHPTSNPRKDRETDSVGIEAYSGLDMILPDLLLHFRVQEELAPLSEHRAEIHFALDRYVGLVPGTPIFA